MLGNGSRRGFLAASGVALATAAAGCSSGGGQGGQGGDPGLVEVSGSEGPELEPNPNQEDLVGGPDWTPPDLSGKELTLWVLNYAPIVDRINSLATRFNRLTNATVKVEPQDEVAEKMLTAVAGNNVPDVVFLMGRMSDQLIRQQVLLDVTDSVYGDLKIDMDRWWYPGGIESYTWDGRQFGVPVDSGGTGYPATVRLDLLEKASSEVQSLWPGNNIDDRPQRFESYDQLFELATALQVTEGGEVSVWGTNRQGWEMQSLANLMVQQGVTWWDEQTLQFDLDNDACIRAIDTMITDPYAMGVEAMLAGGNVVNNFVAGQVAVGLGNASAANEAAKLGMPGENVMTPPLDGMEALYQTEGGWGFEVPVQAKQQDLGVEFLRFITTYEAQFTYIQIFGGWVPACRALAASEIFSGDTPNQRGARRIIDQLPAINFFGHGRDPQCDGILGGIISSVRTGKLDAPTASKELQQQLTAQQQQFQ